MASRRIRILAVSLALLLAIDLAAWTAQVRRRATRLRELAPLVSQMDSLSARIALDDDWIDRNQRLLQGYGQHEELARRLRERGRRVTAHDALVDAYNQRLTELGNRFFLPPLPPLPAEPRDHLRR